MKKWRCGKRKKRGAKKEREAGLWKLTPLMEIRPQRGFPQRLEKDLAKNARLLHSSHRPGGGYKLLTHIRQRCTLRSPIFCPNNGEHLPVSLSDFSSALHTPVREAQQIVEIGILMEQLEASDPDAARVVDMVYFAGFTLEETAEATGLTFRQARSRWERGRGWLKKTLRGTPNKTRNSPSALPGLSA